MTVAQDLNYVEYTGNGVTTIFPFTFKVQDVSQLQVYQYVIATGVATLLDPSLYTVSGTLPGVGSINYAPLGLPMSSLYKVLIYREAALLQNMDIENQGGFLPEVLEIELDRLSMVDQQLQEKLTRALVVDPGNIPPNITDVLIDIAAGIAAATIAVTARDLAQQYAADAAMVSGVNVPIYASVASAQGATIVAGVQSIRTQFRTPSYVIPSTLLGGAEYARMSLVDITSAGLPVVSYFRSTDRFMPDGSTDVTNGGYWAIAERVIHLPMLGALVGLANTVVTTTALAAASVLGRPTFIPPVGDFHSAQVTVQHDNWEVYGDGSGSSLIFTTEYGSGFFAAGKSGLRIHKLKLTGATITVGVSAECGAIYVNDCTNFNFSDLEIVNWPDHGISVRGTPATFAVSIQGYIERNYIHSPAALTRFNSAGISLPENARDITVRDNTVEGGVLNPGDGGLVVGIFCQGISSVYNGGAWGIKILDNIVRHCSAYGISGYDNKTLVVVTGAADNGSGGVRLTAAAHSLNSGEEISVQGVTGTVEANGVWIADVIDANTVDLRYSAFVNAYVSGGTIQYLFQGDLVIRGNTIEYIDGSPSAQNNSNGSFGAGIYLVGVGRSFVNDNFIRYCNLGTTTQSLAPAGIGVASNYGPITISGNIVQDCAWFGIYAPHILNVEQEGELIISDNHVDRCRQVQIYAYERGNLTISGNAVCNRPNVVGSGGIVVDATAAINNVTIADNRIKTYGITRILRTNYVNDLVCTGNQVKNLSPATVVCEAAYFQNGNGGTISGNVFDGEAANYTALTLNACTNYTIEGNRLRMTGSAAARSVAVMTGVCTGSRFGKSNIADINGGSGGIRMENASTGGFMETSGGVAPVTKTRQVGDVHWNDAPVAASTIFSAVTTAGNPPTWKDVALAA